MSDVERVAICDDTEISENNSSNDILTQAMTKIMESYVNAAFNIAFGQDPHVLKLIDESNKEIEERKESSSDNSRFSFLGDAFGTNVGSDLAFCVENDLIIVNNEQEDDKVIEFEEDAQTNLVEVLT